MKTVGIGRDHVLNLGGSLVRSVRLDLGVSSEAFCTTEEARLHATGRRPPGRPRKACGLGSWRHALGVLEAMRGGREGEGGGLENK